MNARTLKMYVFYCSNSLDQRELTRCAGELQGDELKAISLPCSGKVNIPYLVKAFEAGADGVAVITCKQGECRHLEGNLRARKRAEAVDSLLEEIGLGRGRMAVIQLTDGGTKQIIEDIERFCAEVRNMRPARAEMPARPDTDDFAAGSSVSSAHHAQETAL
jgi:coenzyme F420-reducing hydrogenase delta subunit